MAHELPGATSYGRRIAICQADAIRWLIRALAALRLRTTLLFIVLVYLQSACAGERVVFGSIPPSTFQFAPVVDYDGHGRGGWQVAQVVILLGRLSAMFPRAATCDVEVGVPIVNFDGPVTMEAAQIKSAAAADAAAREILQQHERPTASICQLFRETMAELLGDENYGTIPGARVTAFHGWPGKRVPRRTFPFTRGR